LDLNLDIDGSDNKETTVSVSLDADNSGNFVSVANYDESLTNAISIQEININDLAIPQGQSFVLRLTMNHSGSGDYSPLKLKEYRVLAFSDLITDTDPPQFISASINKNRLQLNFSEPLSRFVARNPEQHVSLNINGTSHQIDIRLDSVQGNQAIFDIGIENEVTGSDIVGVSYTDDILRDVFGNRVPAFTNMTVINHTTTDTSPPFIVDSHIDGYTVHLAFNEKLDSDVLPPPF
jgi:hypothetical protein